MTRVMELARVAEQRTPVIMSRDQWVPEHVKHLMKQWEPRSDVGKAIRGLLGLHMFTAEQVAELVERISRSVVVQSSLSLAVIRDDTSREGLAGRREDLGVVCEKVITTAGVGFLVDAWQNLVELEDMKYHAFGTGSNAEAVGNTALHTELTTEYASDNTRPTGTTTEGASANIFRSVATLAPDSGGTLAITEHGLMSQAAVGGGVLWDKSLFSAVNLVASSDSLQATYDMTATAGG